MKEFKKGSSRPQGEESLQEQIRKRITPELTYKKGSIVLKGARLEGTIESNLHEGDYLFDDEK